ATVRIQGPEEATGQAPNEFDVKRGHYRITVSRPQYASQSLEWDLGIAQTKQLFFQLEPIPGRLEIRTYPPNATLYVRGNRARNPYAQQVGPGRYELHAQATDDRP